MSSKTGSCCVCNALNLRNDDPLSRIVVDGRTLSLCRTHATTVAIEMPETFEDLRLLFAGLGPKEERRSPIPRRDYDDRRMFPPRPEGRRQQTGRRATDMLEP